MSKEYRKSEVVDSTELTRFLAEEGQLLLPMVELISEAKVAVDELIEVMGRATLGAVLELSARELVGPPHPGKPRGEIHRHGHQQGVVTLCERKVRVEKPRLRARAGGPGAEVAVPAYEAMQRDDRLQEKLCSILMRGVSTRNYASVLPEMAGSCGVSKSSVSREFIEASAEHLASLCERRFDDLDLLVIYVDGIQFGREHHVIAAVGVASDGSKHVLGLVEGATEHSEVVKGLLVDLVERGVKPTRRRLFVIDGSKALRKVIGEVYGSDNLVQRCRQHKERNVVGHLPKSLQGQVTSVLRAAFRLDANKGMAKLRKQASWLEVEHPSAAASLLEGLEEMFTVRRLQLTAPLERCLVSTNIIESTFSGVRGRTRRVTRWKNGAMALRWAAVSGLEAEKSFRKILGYGDLWMLKAALDRHDNTEQQNVA
jgi:transposase-like protein